MGDVSLETIAQGCRSAYESRGDYVIKDGASWAELWSDIHSYCTDKPDLPEIDFENEMVVAVFMGNKKSSGYAIEIRRIEETDGIFRVFVSEKGPMPDMIVACCTTQPYCIVKTRKTDKEVLFIYI